MQFKGATLLPPTDYLPADYRVYDSGVWLHEGNEKWKQITKRPVTLSHVLSNDFADDWHLFLSLDNQEWDSPTVTMSYSTLLGDRTFATKQLQDNGLDIQTWDLEAFRTFVIKSLELTGEIESSGLAYISPDDIRRANVGWGPRSFKERVTAAMRHFVHRNYLRFFDYGALSYWDKQRGVDIAPDTPAIRYKNRFLFTESGFEQATEGVPARLAARALQENGLLIVNKGALTCRLTLSHVGLPTQKYYAVDAQALMAHQPS